MVRKQHPEPTAVAAITGVSRETIRRAGIDIPDDFNIQDHVDRLKPDLGSQPRYVLWQDGKLAVNDTGGRDVIARLYIERDIVKGWSI